MPLYSETPYRLWSGRFSHRTKRGQKHRRLSSPPPRRVGNGATLKCGCRFCSPQLAQRLHARAECARELRDFNHDLYLMTHANDVLPLLDAVDAAHRTLNTGHSEMRTFLVQWLRRNNNNNSYAPKSIEISSHSNDCDASLSSMVQPVPEAVPESSTRNIELQCVDEFCASAKKSETNSHKQSSN